MTGQTTPVKTELKMTPDRHTKKKVLDPAVGKTE